MTLLRNKNREQQAVDLIRREAQAKLRVLAIKDRLEKLWLKTNASRRATPVMVTHVR